MGLTSTFIQINALVGFVLPLLAAIIQQGQWSTRVRVAVGIAMAIVASIITALAQHKLNLHDWAASAITVYLMAEVSYRKMNKAGLTDAIEYVTTGTQGKRVITHKKTQKKAAGLA